MPEIRPTGRALSRFHAGPFFLGAYAVAPRMKALIGILLTSVAATIMASGDDWPQWLGPQRDAVWRETGIIDTFPEQGPTIRWRAPLNSLTEGGK